MADSPDDLLTPVDNPLLRSILLVEDDPHDAALFRKLLTDAGLSAGALEHSGTLEEALEVCKDKRFDAVLLDLGLPDSKDIVTVDRFVSEYPELPVIVLTGDRDLERARSALRTGAEDYLFKGETAHGRLLLRSVGYAVERKQTREVMKRLESHLLKAQRLESMELLAGGVAHDFNNLLVGIMGNASMALAELPPASEIRSLVAGIERSALAAAELTRQMLAYAGKGRFVVEVSDLSELVSETQELLRASISKSASIRFDVAPEPLPVRMDATQIQQILMNLVTNASEALEGGQGGITITTGQLQVDERYAENLEYNQHLKQGTYAFVEVTDVGIGMDAQTRSRIFDPFFSTKFAGRGLGLAASLGIARGHQGAIRVYSEPGQGSSIKLYLPLASVQGETAPGDGPPWPDTEPSQTLLVVDDNEAVRAVSHRILSRAGYEVLLAEDGAEAISTFNIHGGEVHGVLLDLTMPRMSGEEALRQLRQIQPDVNVILMSGYNEQEVIRRIAGRGLAGFVQKPFLPATLLAKVREVLDSGE